MAYLNSIDQLRDFKDKELNWGRTYLWDMKFPSAPYPFNEWFPAVNFEEGLLTVNSYEWEYYMSSYQVPKSTAPVGVQVEFYDNNYGILLKWLSDWVNNDILNGGLYIGYLTDLSRELFICKLNLDGSLLDQRMYYVYPDGEIPDYGNSNSEATTRTVNFKCVGYA